MIEEQFSTICDLDNLVLGPIKVQEHGSGHGAYLRLPGNPQIAWSFGAFVYEAHRGQGIGQLLHTRRLSEAKAEGIKLMLCSVNSQNTVQLRLLRNNGWSHVSSCRPKNDGSTVEIWQIILE